MAANRLSTLTSAMNESASPYLVCQKLGAFSDVPDFLDAQHAVETAGDAEAWLSRLEAFAVQLDQECERIRRDEGLGVVPPGYILDTTLAQMAAFAATPPPQS